MKNIFIILLFLLPIFLKAQNDDTTKYSRYPNVYGIQYPRIWSPKVLRVPTDTLSSKSGIAQIGTTMYVGNGTRWQPVTGGSSIDTSLYLKYLDSTIKYVTPKQLKDTSTALRLLIGNGGIDTIYSNYDTVFYRKNSVVKFLIVDTFKTNPTVTGTSIGKYGSGSIPSWRGLSARQAILDAITNCVHPTYVIPTASISSSPTATSYEYGINLGTITLSSGFTQNNGGGLTATTYYQNGLGLGSNTTTITSLTTTQTFYVNKSYGQGACINDNCGVQDCFGQINAGNVNSSSISFTPFSKRYLGFVSALQGDGTPSDANVLAAYYNDNSGSTTSINNTAAQQPSDKYLFFVTKSPVTSISINGFPSTAAFNLNITRSFTNAVGGSSTYYFMVSKNPFGSTGTTTISIN